MEAQMKYDYYFMNKKTENLDPLNAVADYL